MSGDSPCKNCEERHYGCHAECDRYTSFIEKRKTENERRINALYIEKGLDEHRLRTSHRIKHDKNKSKILRSHKK